MRSIVIFRFFSHLSLLFVYQCITFLPLIFRFSFYTNISLTEINQIIIVFAWFVVKSEAHGIILSQMYICIIKPFSSISYTLLLKLETRDRTGARDFRHGLHILKTIPRGVSDRPPQVYKMKICNERHRYQALHTLRPLRTMIPGTHRSHKVLHPHQTQKYL